MPERVVGRFQVARNRMKSIPQRLRLDGQAFAAHHAHLALERQVVGVLRDRHADPKLGRIATAGHHLNWTRR
ncbi:MAG: hypothetical protein AUH43_00615 [Acidobacteria bacterium 13_1_40CM_65_14]|nr:MAG: hypothetical protein AUH43_00615 [Acidobacteria bacterium 13_1_40CM_65_14]